MLELGICNAKTMILFQYFFPIKATPDLSQFFWFVALKFGWLKVKLAHKLVFPKTHLTPKHGENVFVID